MWYLFNFFKRSKSTITIDPDEIFLDARNLPSFDNQQFEGRIEKPISKKVLYFLVIIFFTGGLVFLGRIGFIQVVEGSDLAVRSNQNRLRHTLVFADRGIIYDRNGETLAWNDPTREYIQKEGFAHILGYIGYPSQLELKESDFDPKEYIGKNGVENTFNDQLMGQKGVRIEEVDARGKIETDHVLKEATPGSSVTLAIDSRLQAEFFKIIKEVAEENDFTGGAGVIMDVNTGEVVSMVSFPEFDSNVMSKGKDSEKITHFLTDKSNVFLNRAVAGLYTPGSTIKLFIALAALNEKIITPWKTIVSTGQLVVPNPYFPDQPSIFKDWKAHGAVDMRKALAVSSDVYFYQVGGGFGTQKGLGITLIEKYSKLFGFGVPTGIELNAESGGVIPNPAWKEANFNGDPWRLGDTYHTSIGQYGYLVTPLQVARSVAYIANGGKLVKPTLLANPKKPVLTEPIKIAPADFKVVQEGMRLTVTNGTGLSLNTPNVEIAAKSGTAELDAGKRYVNAWISGYFPYNNPHYSFVVVMEQGKRGGSVGGGVVMRRMLDWMAIYTPEYFK